MSGLGYDQGSGFGFVDQTSGLDFELVDQMSDLGCDLSSGFVRTDQK